MKKKGKIRRFRLFRFVTIIIAIIIVANVMIIIHTYSFTHFNPQSKVIHPDNIAVSASDKVKAVFLGADIPKPKTRMFPIVSYEESNVLCSDRDSLNIWTIHTDSVSRGIVVFFHGFMDEKSSMLYRAYSILNMGYDVVLVDFIGAGGSSGTQSTIGYNEAENVKTVYDYIANNLERNNIYLLGFSMGAVAIIKAQNNYQMNVNGIIMEAPYGTLEGTIGRRLDLFNVPRFPLEQLATFWLGAVNGFNGFDLRLQDYVANIHVPLLLMVGGQDQYVSSEEIHLIFDSCDSQNKYLYLFPESKHESYLEKYENDWRLQIRSFLK